MKETKILTLKFICDQCEKISKECKDSGFPYKDDWKYLYKLGFKVKAEKEIKKSDKHFCSLLCMNTYIAKMILETTKNE